MTPAVAAAVAALQLHVCQNMKEITRLQETNQAMLERSSILLKGRLTPAVLESRLTTREAAVGAREACKGIIQW